MNRIKISKLLKLFAIQFFLLIMISGESMGSNLPKYYTKTLENGLQIVGAHIDSPRLDLKPNPLYEDSGFAYFKTHYYGGIKKYQWTTIPLSLHGVIVKANGNTTTLVGKRTKQEILESL